MFVPAVKNIPAVDQRVRLAIQEMEIAAHKAMGTLNKTGNYVGDNLLVRHLYQEEAEALWYYFGHFSLHVSPIVLYATSFGHDWSPYGNVIGLQPIRFVNNDPHLPIDFGFSKNYAAFVHEAVHVWQRQHGEYVTVKGGFLQLLDIVRICDPYRYNKSIKDPKEFLLYFLTCTVEQKAQIVEDYVKDHRSSTNVIKYIDIQFYIKNKYLPINDRKKKSDNLPGNIG